MQELLKYNIKLKEYENEILYLTQEVVTDVMSVIKNNISSLFNVSNTVATLDMLLSFSLFSLEQGMTTQPIILERKKDTDCMVIFSIILNFSFILKKVGIHCFMNKIYQLE